MGMSGHEEKVQGDLVKLREAKWVEMNKRSRTGEIKDISCFFPTFDSGPALIPVTVKKKIIKVLCVFNKKNGKMRERKKEGSVRQN